jgi:hypothetical protein
MRSVSFIKRYLELFWGGDNSESKTGIIRFLVRCISSSVTPGIVSLKLEVSVNIIASGRVLEEFGKIDWEEGRFSVSSFATEDTITLKSWETRLAKTICTCCQLNLVTGVAMVVKTAARLAVPFAVLPFLHVSWRTTVSLFQIHVKAIEDVLQSEAKKGRWEEVRDVCDGFEKGSSECLVRLASLEHLKIIRQAYQGGVSTITCPANTSPVAFIVVRSSSLAAVCLVTILTILTIAPAVELDCDLTVVTTAVT